MPVLEHVETGLADNHVPPFPQYGLLAGLAESLTESIAPNIALLPSQEDPRIFFNVASPSSTFICGSQGSGKSHTLSCLLENCLIPSDASKLPHPLTGLVFHYDTFISDDGGSPCEAAFLSSSSDIRVRVLCSPANVRTIKQTYRDLNVQVEPLQISQSDLTTKRMLDLMAVSQDDKPMPLYLHTLHRILHEMRIEQQEAGTAFNYQSFKRRLMDTPMSPAQLGPLNQRLDMLESFMPKAQTAVRRAGSNKMAARAGNDWTSVPGCLTIIDLSCPCMTSEGACALFNICLGIFLDRSSAVGRIIALDEAHKYMNASVEASTLTNTLLSTIRLQRHLGARVIISTQEPTISPALLDLSSVTIVHRFTSPEWLRALRRHLAGAASDLGDGDVTDPERPTGSRDESGMAKGLFADIVNLRVGEALLFAPSAMVRLEASNDGAVALKRLGDSFMKIKVRMRLTTDGGESIMAT
ncbi:hypothetical protein BDZ45DRAFT_707791 [Acephala macrosclerotiorum]|nr:hypothetical protein BDZ45DRAFT_707791 [Acephala macrosclerotiorum]